MVIHFSMGECAYTLRGLFYLLKPYKILPSKFKTLKNLVAYLFLKKYTFMGILKGLQLSQLQELRGFW